MNFYKSRASIDNDSEKVKTPDVERKLAAHVPDLVVFDENPEKIPHILKFNGVLLFADVSGFTALTERYTVSSEKGTDALTVTLNNYIGKIVECLLKSGSDILKFAGDAILAVWKVKKRPDLLEAISQAARCSLVIQEKCDNQETDVGVQLRVKIAISAGKVYATFVGNKDSRHFVMAGRPVQEVNAAEKYCTAGLVVLSPNAMELSDKGNIITEALDNRFGLVKYLRRGPKVEWKEYIDLPFTNAKEEKDETCLRLSLNLIPDPDREVTIRKYVTPVVQRKLDDGQLLKFLSEMRQCSILFINLAFELNEKDRLFHEKQCIDMQTAFNIVYTNVHDMQGSLNKIFMFDKGCTFLVIFGLPGDKHEQEPAHALQASWKTSQELRRDLPSLTMVSFGVTTGPVFCGVIGHDERHEYTVIGHKVNLAARLMMHYPNMVSCDFDTYHDSKLSSDMFSQLPTKAMKGVRDVRVYQYKEGERKMVNFLVLKKPELPIIGRDAEIELFMEELKRLMKSEKLGGERRIIIFEGEAGYGKTRLMQEIEWLASCENVEVIAYTLSINDLNTPYYAIRVLIGLLLKSWNVTNSDSKEEILTEILGLANADYFCLLNDVLNITFPLSAKVSHIDETTKDLVVRTLLYHIVHTIASEKFVMFALDDAQNVDYYSWTLLSTLSKDARALTVLAMRPFSPDRPSCEPANTIIYHPKTLYVKLSILLNEDLTPLACQLLRVERIPNSLRTLLIERSHGVPLWCEQLLREMQNAQVLLIEKCSDKQLPVQQVFQKEANIDARAKSISPVVAPKTNRARNSSVLSIWSNRNRTIKPVPKARTESQPTSEGADSFYPKRSSKEVSNEITMECVVKPNFDLRKFPVPASIRGMALARLDRMKPFEQIVVKSAAVIGNNTSRQMLKSVVPGFTEDKFKRAIFQLMLSRVFECASVNKALKRQEDGKKQSSQFFDRSNRIVCFCKSSSIIQKEEQEEEIAARCEQFRFHNSMVQETAYKLWLEEQRKSLHETCACYIEEKLNEILLHGTTDEAITQQYHYSKNSMAEQLALSKDQSQNETTSNDNLIHQKPFGIRESVLKKKLSEVLPFEVSSSTASTTTTHTTRNKESHVNIRTSPTVLRVVQEAYQRRFSFLSTPGKICIDGVCIRKSLAIPFSMVEVVAPLELIAPPNHKYKESKDSQLLSFFLSSRRFSFSQNSHNESISENGESSPSLRSSLWLPKQLLPAYETLINNTEEQAKLLPAITKKRLPQTPFEIHENLALLYQQLIHHWRNAAHTEKTLLYLLKAAESSIAILNLSIGFCYLQMANQIVENLEKGQDIVSNQSTYGHHRLEDVKVLAVSRLSKARIHKLMGQVLFRQGHLTASFSHLLKALKILHCSLPRRYLFINIQTWLENQCQRKHLKKPQKFIGSAPCDLAQSYTEQVQCLSYLWQILMKVKEIPNRWKLIKLIAVMQVKLLTGDLVKSATYENKAIMKCTKLPYNLTTSQLFTIAHLHLVCCSLKICHGKLEMALKSGHRAYNIADFLGDLDIKLIVLPLLAQTHLISGRGRPSIDALKILVRLSNVNDDIGMLSYFTTCLDMILESGFSLEKVQRCVEYLKNTEIFDIGDSQHFYARTSLAVWYFRTKDEYAGKEWLKLAIDEIPANLDNFFVIRAYARLVEAALLSFMTTKNSLDTDDKEIKVEEMQYRNAMKELNKLSKMFPVFKSRTAILNAVFQLTIGNPNIFFEQIEKAMKYAVSSGNLVDHQWAHQNRLAYQNKVANEHESPSYWLTNHEAMPNWETAIKVKPSDRVYVFPF